MASCVERAFNIIHAGNRRKDDSLPAIFFEEKDTPEGPVGLKESDLRKMLDDFYQYRGWDNEGIPTCDKLRELGLDDIAARLEKITV